MNTNTTGARYRVHRGVVSGARHAIAGTAGQDAAAAATWTGGVVAVVADGCSSSVRSEIGAGLAAPLLATAVARRLDLGAVPSRATVEDCLGAVLTQLFGLVATAASDANAAIADYLLFTVVVAVAAPDRQVVLVYGDGHVIIDGVEHPVGPFADNAPPYPSYCLLDLLPGAAARCPQPEFVLERHAPLAQTLTIGTDGLAELVARAEQSAAARKLVDQLTGAAALGNATALQRQLTAMQRLRIEVDWDTQRVGRQHGLVSDDVAIVVISREAEAR